MTWDYRCIDDTSDGKDDVTNPSSVYPRIFAAQDVVFARRAKARQTIDLTCLQVGHLTSSSPHPHSPHLIITSSS